MKYLIITLLALCFNASAQGTRQVGNDPSPGNEYQVNWKIGRFDSRGIFHGTDYNDKRYLDKKDCLTGYDDTIESVKRKAITDGGGSAEQDKMVAAFRKLYACHEILVDPNLEIQPQKLAEMVEQQQVQQEREVVEEAPSSPLAYSRMPEPLEYPKTRQAMPTRPYFIAEFVVIPGYKPYWVTYASVYESPSHCHSALREMLREQREQIDARFVQTSRDFNAATQYQHQMAQFTARAKKISCITKGRY